MLSYCTPGCYLCIYYASGCFIRIYYDKALIIGLVFCATILTKKNPIIGGELALIHFVGFFGRVALISVGTAAAGFGAIV